MKNDSHTENAEIAAVFSAHRHLLTACEEALRSLRRRRLAVIRAIEAVEALAADPDWRASAGPSDESTAQRQGSNAPPRAISPDLLFEQTVADSGLGQ